MYLLKSFSKLVTSYLNCSLSPAWVSATMMLVTLVPMLAPMIMGMAVCTGAPAHTTPSIIEVEDDCTRTVTRTPIINPITGLVNSSELENTAPLIHKLDSNMVESAEAFYEAMSSTNFHIQERQGAGQL